MRECQTARESATAHRRFAAYSYLVLVDSAELALYSPARLEVARKAATVRRRFSARSYLAQVGSARRHSARRGDSAVRERQTARESATAHRRFAAYSYLVLVDSAELALHSPARLEVARKAATVRRRFSARSYLVQVGSARRHSTRRGDSAVRERQTARESATMRHRSAARPYLVLVDSAEFAPTLPCEPGGWSCEEATATMRRRFCCVLVPCACGLCGTYAPLPCEVGGCEGRCAIALLRVRTLCLWTLRNLRPTPLRAWKLRGGLRRCAVVFAACSYLVLVDSAELMPHSPARLEVARDDAPSLCCGSVPCACGLCGICAPLPCEVGGCEGRCAIALLRARTLCLWTLRNLRPTPLRAWKLRGGLRRCAVVFAACSYLVLVGSVESAPYSPARPEVAHEAPDNTEGNEKRGGGKGPNSIPRVPRVWVRKHVGLGLCNDAVFSFSEPPQPVPCRSARSSRERSPHRLYPLCSPPT